MCYNGCMIKVGDIVRLSPSYNKTQGKMKFAGKFAIVKQTDGVDDAYSLVCFFDHPESNIAFWNRDLINIIEE